MQHLDYAAIFFMSARVLCLWFLLMACIGYAYVDDFQLVNQYEHLIVEEKYQEAIDQLLTWERYFIKQENWSGLVLLYCQLGTYYYYIYERSTAEQYYQKAQHLLQIKKIPSPFHLFLQARWCMYYALFRDMANADTYKKKLIQKEVPDTLNPKIQYEIYFTLEAYHAYISKNFDSAIYYNKLAAAILANYTTKLTVKPAFNTYLLAKHYFNKGNQSKSIKYANQALGQFKSIQSNLEIGYCYELLVMIYRQKHDFDKALQYINLLLNHKVKSLYAKANTYRLAGKVYYELQAYDQAKQALKQALSLYNELQNDEDKQYIFALYAIDLLGNVLEQLHDDDSAYHYYNYALQVRQKMFGRNHPELTVSYTNLARLNKGSNKSIAYLKKILSIIEQNEGEFHYASSRAHRLTAEHYMQDSTELAQYHVQKAIQHACTDMADQAIYVKNIRLPGMLLNALNIKGNIYLNNYQQSQSLDDLASALQTFEQVIQLGDSIRIGFQFQGSQMELAQITDNSYQDAISTSLKINQITQDASYLHKAFTIAEKSKAAVLLASQQKTQAKVSVLPQHLLDEEADLLGELNYYVSQIEQLDQKKQKTDSELELYKQLKGKEFELKEQLEEFLEEVERNYPAYYKLKYKLPNVEVAQIQKSLLPGQKMISYYEGDSTLTVFVVGPDSFHVSALKIQAHEANLVPMLRKSLADGGDVFMRDTSRSAFVNSAHELYLQWLQPVEDYLEEGEELIIVPYGQMGLVPFEVLLCSKPAQADYHNYKKLDYLIRHYAISYANSATLWWQSLKPKSLSANTLLAMAPSFENGSIPAQSQNLALEREVSRESLEPLAWTKKELEYIGAYFDGTFLNDQQADEGQFKDLAPQADIIHIASHAFAQDKRPMYAKIYFSDSDSTEDAMLHAFELYNLKLKAKLAVLSACNTGFGNVSGSEGIMNLARGFIYAGCPSVVMSLWNADDHSSAEIMKHFYHNLYLGQRKSEALRNAKLTYLDNSRHLKTHPYYWGQFIANGDMQPIKRKPVQWYWWALAFLVMALVVGVVIRARR